MNCALSLIRNPILLAVMSPMARAVPPRTNSSVPQGCGVLMALLILGEMAGFAVVVTGVVFGQLVASPIMDLTLAAAADRPATGPGSATSGG